MDNTEQKTNKNRGCYAKKEKAKLSQGSKQMLQIAINPFPNAIFLSLSYLFWQAIPLPYCYIASIWSEIGLAPEHKKL